MVLLILDDDYELPSTVPLHRRDPLGGDLLVKDWERLAPVHDLYPAVIASSDEQRHLVIVVDVELHIFDRSLVVVVQVVD